MRITHRGRQLIALWRPRLELFRELPTITAPFTLRNGGKKFATTSLLRTSTYNLNVEGG